MKTLAAQRGLSLIELMVAILLSSLLLFGVLQIFDGNRNTMRMQTAFARVQESGRFAMDLLTKEIRMADYWGCAPDDESIQDHLDHDDTDWKADVHGRFGADGVLGKDNVSGETVGPGAMTVLDGTDILILSGADDACGGTGRMMPSSTAASLHVSQNCGVEPGQTVLITNCQSGELLTITDVQAGNGGDSGKRTVVHNTGKDGDGWVQNDTKNLQREYGADSKVLLPYQRTYFIADSNGGSSLFVSVNGGAPQELVPGIEDLQVLYGRDTDANDVLDTWSKASANTDDMAQSQSVKVQLVVASDVSVNADDQTITDLDKEDTDYTDGRLRKIYLSSAKIRNRGDM